MKYFHIAGISAALLLSVSACHHKDVTYDIRETAVTEIIFDWRNAPDADPESMAAYFYGASRKSPLRYVFSGRDGGSTKIPFDAYKGVAVNADNTDWAKLRTTENIDSYEIYTSDADELQAYGLSTRSVPRAAGSSDERIAVCPGMLWSDRRDSIYVVRDKNIQVVTFYPEECVSHYMVDIFNVDNLDYLHGVEIDATLSGMADGFSLGKKRSTSMPVTFPFILKSDVSRKSLHSEFLTFGECDEKVLPHTLTVYMILTDGTKWYYTFDVASQIYSAPDPHNVHIVIDGLRLPKPISAGGGLKPDVNEWQSEHIDLNM